MQSFRAARYLGRRLRVSAWVKGDHAGQAAIWMRVDGVSSTLTFDNMRSRAAHGTFDWRRQQIVLDVPDDAATINYGLILQRTGQAWVDDFVFEVVDKHVKSTGMMLQVRLMRSALSWDQYMSLAEDATNTDFEQPSSF